MGHDRGHALRVWRAGCKPCNASGIMQEINNAAGLVMIMDMGNRNMMNRARIAPSGKLPAISGEV